MKKNLIKKGQNKMRLKNLTYSLKKQLAKKGKNVENYKIKGTTSGGNYIIINTATKEEFIMKG